MSWQEDANTGSAVELSIGMAVTEADAVLKELAAESTVDMGVSGFRVAAGATAASSVTHNLRCFQQTLRSQLLGHKITIRGISHLCAFPNVILMASHNLQSAQSANSLTSNDTGPNTLTTCPESQG